MKIVVLDGYTANPGDLSWDGLKSLGDLTVYERTPKEDTEIIRRIGNAEAVFVNKCPISRGVLDACPNMKFIGVLATGFNIVDVAAAKEKGIAVCNVPAYSTGAVVQMSLALLFEICCHVGLHNDSVHRGDWQNGQDFSYTVCTLKEVQHKTIGIVGFGQIGKAEGRACKALGMNVIFYTPHPDDEGRAIGRSVDLDTLLRQSDIISLHCPSTKENEGFINKEAIAKMKDGAILINTARGQLINEQDLADALNSGKIYGAGLDVLSVEPVRADNPLLKAKNCIMTPHIAWAPFESRTRLMEITVANLKAFMDGHPQNDVTNK